MHDPRNMKYPNPSETGFPNSIESEDALAWCSNPFGVLSQIIPSTTMSSEHVATEPYEILGDRQRKACNFIQVRGFNMWSCPYRGKKTQVRPCSTFFPNTTVNSNLKRQINTHNSGAKNGAMFFPIVTLPSSKADQITNEIKHKLSST